MERPDSMVVGNDIDSKGSISHKIHIGYDQSNHIKTTNLSTYTPIEIFYTPLAVLVFSRQAYSGIPLALGL